MRYILNIRGYQIAVQARSGTQLRLMRQRLEQRSDEWLAQEAENNA